MNARQVFHFLLLANWKVFYNEGLAYSQKHKIRKQHGFSNLPMASTSRAHDPNLDMIPHIFVPSPVSTEHTQSPAKKQDKLISSKIYSQPINKKNITI